MAFAGCLAKMAGTKKKKTIQKTWASQRQDEAQARDQLPKPCQGVPLAFIEGQLMIVGTRELDSSSVSTHERV